MSEQSPREIAMEKMLGKPIGERWQVAFDVLLMAVTAFRNGGLSLDELHYRARIAEEIANLGEPSPNGSAE